jgi:hypothetical protein
MIGLKFAIDFDERIQSILFGYSGRRRIDPSYRRRAWAMSLRL